MAQVPTGTTWFVTPSSGLGSAITVTGVTNATEAVVTAAAHGLVNGDIILTALGWGRIDKRAFRVKSSTTNTFALEGCDTTNTNFFPNGTTIGTVQKVTSFQQITQVLTTQGSGGAPKTVNYKYMESDVEYSINDGFGATTYTIDLDADALGTAGYAAMQSLTDTQTLSVVKMVMRSGSIVLFPGTVALNPMVTLQDGQVNKVQATINCNGRPTRY